MLDAVLKDLSGNRFITARVISFTKRHLTMWEVQWKRYILEGGYPDSKWDWNAILTDAVKDLALKSFCIEHEEQLQGLMICGTDRNADQDGNPLIFVEYMATAPWNRPGNRMTKDGKARFALVGTWLIFVAVRLSLDSGFRGRVALHSEPTAEHFYELIGMERKGKDPDGYEYFEFDAKVAQAFMKKLEAQSSKAVKPA